MKIIQARIKDLKPKIRKLLRTINRNKFTSFSLVYVTFFGLLAFTFAASYVVSLLYEHSGIYLGIFYQLFHIFGLFLILPYMLIRSQESLLFEISGSDHNTLLPVVMLILFIMVPVLIGYLLYRFQKRIKIVCLLLIILVAWSMLCLYPHHKPQITGKESLTTYWATDQGYLYRQLRLLQYITFRTPYKYKIAGWVCDHPRQLAQSYAEVSKRYSCENNKFVFQKVYNQDKDPFYLFDTTTGTLKSYDPYKAMYLERKSVQPMHGISFNYDDSIPNTNTKQTDSYYNVQDTCSHIDVTKVLQGYEQGAHEFTDEILRAGGSIKNRGIYFSPNCNWLAVHSGYKVSPEIVLIDVSEYNK